MQNNSFDINSPLLNNNYDQLKHYHGFIGRFLNFFGVTVKVFDKSTHQEFYVKSSDLTKALIGNNIKLSSSSLGLIKRRIIEITSPDSRKGLSLNKIKKLFHNYHENTATKEFNSEKTILETLEKIKLDLSKIKPIYFQNSLLEIVNELRPGDIIARKYHEDNPNIICKMQQVFSNKGYREAYKFSHLAIYLGEINGDHWIGEASMPHEHDAQIRRIKIDDPRFELKEKNQYIVFRRNNEQEAKETARLAKNYTIKLLPKTEREAKKEDNEGTLKYNLLEAVRSLFHSSALDYLGHHRLLKYYSDYKNGIPFEYLGEKRGFFCSHFAFIMESMSELNKSEKFQKFLKKHPMPHKYDEKKTGIALRMSKLWYSVRKGFWSRYVAINYGKKINKYLTTKLDALRTTPQAAINYMMDHKQDYSVVGLITREKDYIKD